MRLAAVLVAIGMGCARPAVGQDVARGAALFETCMACHSLDPREQGLPGPPLGGLAGRLVGSAPGFDYSPALVAAGRRGLRWDAARLATFLADPDSMFPGTWMSPPGGLSEADRADLAAHLMRSD